MVQIGCQGLRRAAMAAAVAGIGALALGGLPQVAKAQMAGPAYQGSSGYYSREGYAYPGDYGMYYNENTAGYGQGSAATYDYYGRMYRPDVQYPGNAADYGNWGWVNPGESYGAYYGTAPDYTAGYGGGYYGYGDTNDLGQVYKPNARYPGNVTDFGNFGSNANYGYPEPYPYGYGY